MTHPHDQRAIDTLRADVEAVRAMLRVALTLAAAQAQRIEQLRQELADARAAWARVRPEMAPDEEAEK